jgi:heat shock protein 1/8
MTAIGIDLGTTYSCVAIYKDESVEILPNAVGNKTTPSMVAFSPDSEPIVGDAAKAQLPTNPNNTVFGVKRMIGKSFNDPNLQHDIANWPFQVVQEEKKGKSFGRPKIRVSDRGKTKDFYPEEISAKVLEYLLNVAREKTGDRSITDAVITVPAYFTDAQRTATKEAGRIAGMNVLRILTEPTAAAIAFGVSTGEEHTVLVFDLGGGTFDISILQIDSGVYEVKSINGNDHLGGEDFDNELVKYLASEFNKKNGCDITTNQRAMMLLKQHAEIAKKTLSQATSATVYIEKIFNGKDINEKISRAKFEEINKVHFDKLIPLVRESIKNIKDGMDKDDITDLILVGGSSRIPIITSLLKEEFPALEPCARVNPDEAVANGAAIHAYNLIREINEDDDDDDNAIILVEACPHTRGIEAEGFKMEAIIEKNTPVPCCKERIFTTTYDYQDTINIIVFEGEDPSTKSDKNKFMGQYLIQNIPKKKKGEVSIKVNFDLTNESLLEVTTTVKGTEICEIKTIELHDRAAPGEPMREMRVGATSVDVLFAIDATGSMQRWLKAAVDRAQKIADDARRKHPKIKFRFGAVFYRDPVDVPDDKNVLFDLSENVDNLRNNMAREVADGGGDGPEDWVGCYRIINEQVSWDSNAGRAIVHIADAPAHGREWGGLCEHQDQSPLLAPLIRQCAKKGIIFQGIKITDYPKKSFEKIEEIYRAEGGIAETVDFDSSGESAADFLEKIVGRVIQLAIKSKK